MSESSAYGSVVLRPVSSRVTEKKPSLSSVVSAATKINELEQKFAKRRSIQVSEPANDLRKESAEVNELQQKLAKRRSLQLSGPVNNSKKVSTEATAPPQLSELQKRLAKQKSKLDSTTDEEDTWADSTGVPEYAAKIEISSKPAPSLASIAKVVFSSNVFPKSITPASSTAEKTELQLAFERRQSSSRPAVVPLEGKNAIATASQAAAPSELQRKLERQRSLHRENTNAVVTALSSSVEAVDALSTAAIATAAAQPPIGGEKQIRAAASPGPKKVLSSPFAAVTPSRSPSQRLSGGPSELQLKLERQKLLLGEAPSDADISEPIFSASPHGPPLLARLAELKETEAVAEAVVDSSQPPLHPGLMSLGGLLDGLARSGIVAQPLAAAAGDSQPQLSVSEEELAEVSASPAAAAAAANSATTPTVYAAVSTPAVFAAPSSPQIVPNSVSSTSPLVQLDATAENTASGKSAGADSPIARDGSLDESANNLLFQRRLSDSGQKQLQILPPLFLAQNGDGQSSPSIAKEVKAATPIDFALPVDSVAQKVAAIESPRKSTAAAANTSLPHIETPQTSSIKSLPISPISPETPSPLVSQLPDESSLSSSLDLNPRPLITRNTVPAPLEKVFSRFVASYEAIKVQALLDAEPEAAATQTVSSPVSTVESEPTQNEKKRTAGTECRCCVMM